MQPAEVDHRPLRQRRPKLRELPERMAMAVTTFAGTTTAATMAMIVVVAWAVSGPLFDYSNEWQLVINTGTTIVTFLMVFLIQRSQNKDALAIHLKLNEIVAAVGGASNRLVTAEDLSERELDALHKRYRRLAAEVGIDDPRGKHSVEEGRHRRRRSATPGSHPHRVPPRRRRRAR
jgi:low affinity Fe/Cu permease